jgi:hypothetical protein
VINQQRLAKIYGQKAKQKGGYWKNAERKAEKQVSWLVKTMGKI